MNRMDQIFEKEEYLFPKNGETSRNQLQHVAVFAIYDFLTYRDMKNDINVEDIISGLEDTPYEDCSHFVKAALIYSIKYFDEAVEKYNAKMIKWTFDRLNRVEQAILLLSYVHFHYIDSKVDKNIVINIGVNLAKTYLETKDYKFVNAILDKVLQR